MDIKDIDSLHKITDLVEDFIKKVIIKRRVPDFNNIHERISKIGTIEDSQTQEKQFKGVLKKLDSILTREYHGKTYFLVGGHGGVIIDDKGFCEFDSPLYALDTLIKKMKLAIDTNMPYNLEIAACCLEWLNKNHPDKFKELLRLFHDGRFEIINPSYAQPYSLIIGPESNLKHFEYGLKVLKNLGLDCKIYYCSESSIHPQIPQVLKGFNIKYGSLRTRLLGLGPTSISAIINWKGLDDTVIDSLIDQSSIFNGEYWHGTFFKEIPNLLFQAVARPFMNYFLHSSIEDFIMEQPFQEDVWRLSKHSDIFGKFLGCSEAFDTLEKDGEFKFSRDQFMLGDYIFLPTELFLNNKNAEILLSMAEKLNFLLAFYERKSDDEFLDKQWKNLLLAQAHDSYAVPFIRTGDYSRAQLTKEEYKSLDITQGECSISELSNQILNEIQEKCGLFFRNALLTLSKEIGKINNELEGKSRNVIIFNPTPYYRRDIAITALDTFDPKNYQLLIDEKPIKFSFHNKFLSFISEVPPFGYQVYTFSEGKSKPSKPTFLYSFEISEDNKGIHVKLKEDVVFELRFQTQLPYVLSLKHQFQDAVEDRNMIKGKLNDNEFNLQITQYSEVNRLEFYLDSQLLKEIILTPQINVEKTIVNYPFGIEETKRTNIQTLDFIWLKGSKRGIVYIQKNSQKFKINRETFEIRNSILSDGIYTFSISITEDGELYTPLLYKDSYYLKLFGMYFDGAYNTESSNDSFLTIEPPIIIINLWRREGKSYIRLFNPSNEEEVAEINGKLIKNQLTEIDFSYNEIQVLNTKFILLKPWEIKTFKF